MFERIKMIVTRVKQDVTGELIHGDKVIIDRGHTTLRLNLRRKKKTGELFLGIALFSHGQTSYHAIEGRSIGEFFRIVSEAKALLDAEVDGTVNRSSL